MRTRIARLLRRAANRLDPLSYPGNVYWANVLTSNTSGGTGKVVRIHTGPDPQVVTGATRLANAQREAARALEALADAQQALVNMRRQRGETA